MGSCDFTTTSTGKTAQEAYNKAVDRASDEYGSDPYNGTISTTRGFTMVPCSGKDIAAIHKWIDQQLERTAKWGKCHCTEIPPLNGEKIPEGQKLFLFAGWAAE